MVKQKLKSIRKKFKYQHNSIEEKKKSIFQIKLEPNLSGKFVTDKEIPSK